MRTLAGLVLLLSLAGCGSSVRPQAVPTITSSPAASSPSPEQSLEPSTTATSSSAPVPAADPSSAAPLASGAPALVARAGQRYAVTAEVVHLPGKTDQLCAPVAEPAASGDVKPCAFGLPIAGVDFAHLQGRVEKDQAVRGRAALTVTLDRGALRVVTQTVPPAIAADPGFRDPPCTPPRGGWPKGKDGEALDQKPVEDYRQKHPGALVTVAMLRPSRNQVVEYVLTSGDPAQVDRDLRPSYGTRFCAFRSTFTRKQADSADLDPAFRYGRARGVYLRDSSRLSLSGQLEVHVGAVARTAALTAAVKRAPAGLVRLEELLVPV